MVSAKCMILAIGLALALVAASAAVSLPRSLNTRAARRDAQGKGEWVQLDDGSWSNQATGETWAGSKGDEKGTDGKESNSSKDPVSDKTKGDEKGTDDGKGSKNDEKDTDDGKGSNDSKGPVGDDTKGDEWVQLDDGSWSNQATGETWGGDKGQGKGDVTTSVYPQSCITHDGVRRCWLTYAPTAAPSSVPLIIDLHGGGGSAAGQAAYSEWTSVADSQGAVVVWADGIDGMWNSEGSAATADSKFNQDDVGFLRLAIASILEAHPTVDSSRIYMTGYSLGCFMSHGFAVEASDLVAAVACSAGTLAIPTAPSGYQPTSVMHVHGTQDAVIPYLTATVETFAEFNGCERSPAVSSHTGYNRHQYSNCNGDVEVVLIELLGVGHSMVTSVPTTQLSWDFISRFTSTGTGTSTGAGANAPLAPATTCASWTASKCGKTKVLMDSPASKDCKKGKCTFKQCCVKTTTTCASWAASKCGKKKVRIESPASKECKKGTCTRGQCCVKKAKTCDSFKRCTGGTQPIAGKVCKGNKCRAKTCCA